MPVYLVGAGPGDPELLTLKGRRVLAEADAVLYDELANPVLLAWAPAGAERHGVGRRRGRQAWTQEEICAWMIERARTGARVVRLKGGDPMIFGRGGEEYAALRRAGIAVEIVPGVSAAQGAAAATGIPLTLRGVAGGVRYVAGHEPVRAPYAPGETLVIYMGLARLGAIAEELRRQGWPAATAMAVIGRGTLPEQQLVTGRLDGIAARAAAARVEAPALIVAGDVVGWRAALDEEPSAPRTGWVGVGPRGTRNDPGVILLAHGSRLPGWQREVERLAASLARPGRSARAAFLAPVRPGLLDAVGAAAQAGERRLVVVPYFLAAGLHVTRDLPELAAGARRAFPEVELRLAGCLEGHPGLREAILARAAEVALCWEHAAEGCVAGPAGGRQPRAAAVHRRAGRAGAKAG